MFLRFRDSIMRARAPCKQSHTRFDVRKVMHGLDVDEEAGKLVMAATKDTSNEQYRSRLNTLEKFLREIRGVTAAPAHTCSKEEWVLYMANWHRQKMGPANGQHCALLQLHRSLGMVPSFLEQRMFWKMTYGASSNFVRVPKGVLDATMQASFLSYLPFAKAMERPCKGCGGHTNRIRLTEIAFEVMTRLHIRPGNLKDMEAKHVEVALGRIFVPNWKTTKDGIHLPLTRDVMQLLLEALTRSPNDYMFHRCVDKHMTEVLREAEVTMDWPRGLVFSVHCLRHTGMSNKVGKIESAVKQLVASVTGQTFDHYAEPLQKRVRRG